MSNTVKIILIGLLTVVLIGAAFLIGRALGGGGSIEKTVQFTINVNVPGDFQIAITPEEATCSKGEILTFQITNTVSGGFDAKIQYDVAGLPANSWTFSVNPVNPGQATTLTVNTALLSSNTAYVCALTAHDL